MLRLRRWVNDPLIEIMLSLLTPFLAFWPPVYLGGSGVLATLAAGLYTSWNGPRLISPATRLQGVFFWEFFTYVIEGMVFLITGLQARTVIGRISHYPLSQLALSVAVITAVVIVARFVWVFPATYLPRWLFPAIRKKGPFTAVAVAICAGIHWCPRHRFARGGACHSVCRRHRSAISLSRFDPVSDVFGDPRNTGRARSPAAVGYPRARTFSCRTQGTRNQ
jgi:Sodium/hydrogen exchanger family